MGLMKVFNMVMKLYLTFNYMVMKLENISFVKFCKTTVFSKYEREIIERIDQ